jgi:hypothetical protein
MWTPAWRTAFNTSSTPASPVRKVTASCPPARSLPSKPTERRDGGQRLDGVITHARVSSRRSSTGVGSEATTSPRLTMAMVSQSACASSR